MNADTVVLDGTCRLLNALNGACRLINRLDGNADKVILVSSDEYYTGDYEVTPGSEAIILETEELKVSENVVINPVPSNYGLITWNGSVLMVS